MEKNRILNANVVAFNQTAMLMCVHTKLNVSLIWYSFQKINKRFFWFVNFKNYIIYHFLVPGCSAFELKDVVFYGLQSKNKQVMFGGMAVVKCPEGMYYIVFLDSVKVH